MNAFIVRWKSKIKTENEILKDMPPVLSVVRVRHTASGLEC